MKKVVLNTGTHVSEITVGASVADALASVSPDQTVIITDDNVHRIYKDSFKGFRVISVPPGEESKSLASLESVAYSLLDTGLGRDGFILAIGGGVVCDLAGFLASVYMRGIRFGFISTTLLSQVDASVGGKNGVNLRAVKNILGTFNQPDFVICDQAMLKTLPVDEYLSGLAELIKMGAILSSALLFEIEQNIAKILDRDSSVMERLIFESVSLKADVVREDEREAGKRMILNFGHTFGHVIESYTRQKHGLAVAAGMEIAARISVMEGLLAKDQCESFVKLLIESGLIREYSVPANECRRLITSDKKRKGDEVSFVLLTSLGNAVIRKIPLDRLMTYYESITSAR